METLVLIGFGLFVVVAIWLSVRMDLDHRKRIESIDVEEAWKKREPREPA